MCKSANEPGGPYRCAGHARKKFETAQESFALQRAAINSTEPVVREAEDDLVRAETHGTPDEVNEANEHLARVKKIHAGNQKGYEQNRARLVTARTEWEATPAGAAHLHAMIDHNRVDGSPAGALITRLRDANTAIERNNTTREQNNVTKFAAEPAPPHTQQSIGVVRGSVRSREDATATEKMVLDDRICGSAHTETTPTDRGMYKHTITLHPMGDTTSKGVKATMHTPHTEPPTVADAVNHLAADAREYRDAGGSLFAYRRDNQVDSDDPSATAASRAHFEQLERSDKGLTALLGSDERVDEYGNAEHRPSTPTVRL